jgi:hypothetical protein
MYRSAAILGVGFVTVLTAGSFAQTKTDCRTSTQRRPASPSIDVGRESSGTGRRSAADAQALIDRGLNVLKAKQNPRRRLAGQNQPPAMTAIVLKAFVEDGKYDAKTDFVKKGYDKLLSYQLESGGIYKDLLANYNTAIAISSSRRDEPSFKPRIDKAVAYLKGLQWTESIDGPKGEKIADDKNPGTAASVTAAAVAPTGSNMQVALDALHDAGLKPDDPRSKPR